MDEWSVSRDSDPYNDHFADSFDDDWPTLQSMPIYYEPIGPKTDLNPQDLYAWYYPPEGQSDYQDGRWFQTAQQDFCSQSDEIVVGLIIYTDRTHTDAMDQHGLEPVRATFSFFTHEARRNPNTWFMLGFVKSLKETQASANTGATTNQNNGPFGKGQACCNYHT